MAKVELQLLVLKTGRLEELRSFYGALGIELVEEQHGKGPKHYSGKVGATLLELYPLGNRDGEASPNTVRLGFSVSNLEETLKEAQKLGVKISTTPRATEWGLQIILKDPDGRTLELTQV